MTISDTKNRISEVEFDLLRIEKEICKQSFLSKPYQEAVTVKQQHEALTKELKKLKRQLSKESFGAGK